MKRLKQVWVSPEVHQAARKKAANEGCTIAEAIARALGHNAKDCKKKVNNYGLFK